MTTVAFENRDFLKAQPVEETMPFDKSGV